MILQTYVEDSFLLLKVYLQALNYCQLLLVSILDENSETDDCK